MGPGEDELRRWMLAGLDGDAAAHAALLAALVPLLSAHYRRRLGGGADVDDLVQETLLAVHARRESFDRGRPFMPWLFSIARYKMIDRLRARRATVQVEELEDVLAGRGFEDEVGARIDIDRLLGTLPPKQAAVIRRTRLDGLSIAEAAAAARIGESDVKVSVHRGLKALTARLRRERR